jgi:hypothetical protein
LGADPIAATTLGLQNIDRVAGYLVEATCKSGEDYDLLRNMYGELIGQRNRELGHVVSVVGGFVRNNVWYGDGERQYEPVTRDSQAAAVAFLNQHAFQTPRNLVAPEILERLESSGAADRILAAQQVLLRQLVNENRVKRMAEFADRAASDAYAPIDLLDDLREGIWSELQDSTSVAIDLYRRNLQRAFTDLMIDHVRQERAASDLPALARGQLERTREAIAAATGRQTDETSRLHPLDLAARIDAALDPDNAPSQTTVASSGERTAPGGTPAEPD